VWRDFVKHLLIEEVVETPEGLCFHTMSKINLEYRITHPCLKQALKTSSKRIEMNHDNLSCLLEKTLLKK
jgi:hypothetical protein